MRQKQWASQSHTEIASICWLACASFVGAIQGTDHMYVPNSGLCYVRATERTVHTHMTIAVVALMLDFVYVCKCMCTCLCMYVITCDFVYVCNCMCICVCESCPPLLLLMCLPSCARVTMLGVLFYACLCISVHLYVQSHYPFVCFVLVFI